MTAAKSTITDLQKVMPGQTEAWYQRIASEITAGRMPMPKIDPVEAPRLTPQTVPPPIPATVNPARQRFTEGPHRSTPSAPVATITIEPPAPPKSVVTIEPEPPKPIAARKPTSNIPNTVGEALQQAAHKPKRPAQPANASTKWKLERLVHGDKRAGERLAAQVAFANPGKSEQWCWEKAICDLERDRH